MRRLSKKLVHGFSRLAFWRKPVDPIAEPSDPDPVAALETMPEAAATDVPANPPGWFARLQNALRHRRNPERESPADPDQSLVAERPARQPPDTSPDDAPAAPKRALLAVLKSKLRRAPPSEQLEMEPEADEGTSPSRASLRQESTRSRRDDDAAEEEDAIPLSPLQRALAVLSNKWVWIPGLGLTLLVPLVAMALMLFQSAQEKEQLQTQLRATQKKLDQAVAEKKTAARQAAPRQPLAPTVAAADPTASATSAETKPRGAAGECEISDKESVTLNLKNCIEDFNALTQ